MSNDLISRSALIKSAKKWLPADPCGKEQSIREEVATDLAASMLMEIEEAPTAYDVDAVCEKIENTQASFSCRKFQEGKNESKSCSGDCGDELIKLIIQVVRNRGKKE